MNFELNQVALRVALNHKEERKIRNTNFNVYTLTDLISGKNFDVWSISKIDFIEKMQLITELKTILFNLVVDDTKIKLRPVEVVK